MRYLSGICSLVLLLSVRLLLAQDTPFPLEVTDIFDSSVEVRYVQEEAEETPFPWDDELRRFVVDEAVYEYPEAFDRIYDIEVFDDHTLLLGTTFGQGSGDVFVFDRENKTLNQFEDQCRHEGLLSPQTLIEELWTVYTEENTDISHLCNRMTGELSGSLPAEHSWIFDTGIGRRPLTLVSPDRQDVAFLGETGSKGGFPDLRSVEVYNYNIASGAISRLGLIEAGPYLYIDRWIDRWIAIETGTPRLLVPSRSISPRLSALTGSYSP